MREKERHLKHRKHCITCGDLFTAHYIEAKYYKDACRQMAYRCRSAGNTVTVKKQKWGVAYILYKRKPDYLHSRLGWRMRGWKPKEEARPHNWTYRGKSAHRLYHIRDCVIIGGEKAAERRVKHGYTIEEVEDMLPMALYQLKMEI